eukprot:SAG25_NODE_69_length_17425_cov_289.898476_2_plen_216_part_00
MYGLRGASVPLESASNVHQGPDFMAAMPICNAPEILSTASLAPGGSGSGSGSGSNSSATRYRGNPNRGQRSVHTWQGTTRAAGAIGTGTGDTAKATAGRHSSRTRIMAHAQHTHGTQIAGGRTFSMNCLCASIAKLLRAFFIRTSAACVRGRAERITLCWKGKSWWIHRRTVASNTKSSSACMVSLARCSVLSPNASSNCRSCSPARRVCQLPHG